MVALKLLDHHPLALRDAGQASARLQREARAITALDHPGICRIHDAGELDGIPFIAMHFVGGETLAHRIKRAREVGRAEARWTPDDAIALIEGAARALHVAH